MPDINEIVDAIPTSITFSVEYVGDEEMFTFVHDNDTRDRRVLEPGNHLIFFSTTDHEIYDALGYPTLKPSPALDFYEHFVISKFPSLPQLGSYHGVKTYASTGRATKPALAFAKLKRLGQNQIAEHTDKLWEAYVDFLKGTYDGIPSSDVAKRLQHCATHATHYEIARTLQDVIEGKYNSR